MTRSKPPAPQIVARRVAGLLVERLDLTPPVDVEALLRSRAELHRVDWPFADIDAIMIGLGFRTTPTVYYRATDNLFRERFTLAHELGHLTLPHLPRENCSIQSDGEMDLQRDYTAEDEADVFASCLLLPDRWLLELVRRHAYDMTQVLRELNEAEVTTQAALRGLRRVLLAGWAFAAYRGTTIISTPGTAVPGLYEADALTQLEKHSVASGSADLNGYTVRWFQLAESSVLAARVEGDQREVPQILKDALAQYAPAHESVRLVQVCNGKVGGALRESAGRPAAETYSSLVYRFEQSEQRQLLEVPDFRLWLAEKARDVEDGKTKRRRR